jgi:hypothetical protein
MIYVENRRLITRAPDQIEDIKLVIEFWFKLLTRISPKWGDFFLSLLINKIGK